MTQNMKLAEGPTRDLLDWVAQVYRDCDDPFERAELLSRRLGAHYADGYTTIGWWAPDLLEVEGIEWALEVLTPPDDLDLRAGEQTVTFTRQRVPLASHGEYAWGVVEGMQPGSKDKIGDFYWLRLDYPNGTFRYLHDHFAYSVPYGTLAPAELYDVGAMFAGRRDADHFPAMTWDPDPAHNDDSGIPRVAPPLNILQVHPGTASADGTLAGLTEIYAEIGRKLAADEPLAAWEQTFIDYDAVELMPVEPSIEHEAGPLFWQTMDDSDPGQVTVTLRTHDIIDWGYDVMVSASPAVNPAILRSKRPDELLELIETLHNFPTGPIMVMFDIVYGHTDNQAQKVFHASYLSGPNMYGQNLNYLNPATRAAWLEMSRRKNNYGVDGVRVDGAQDFKNWNPETFIMEHDDDFLRQMNYTVQEAAGQQYYPYMIFEDGRPWPREDWELASSYLEINKQMKNVWQWGPLTFAHNTPFLFTFWVNKWWRVQEVAQLGKYWITGCSNHDTLRRGTQVPVDARVNSRLGETLPEIFRNAYDNPATKLFDYAMMPGIPMEFVNASMRAPWSFIRNTDDKYGVKVVSEEARFLRWAVWEERWAQPDAFIRLKALGLTTLDAARYFFEMLDHLVQATINDLARMAMMLNAHEPPLAGDTEFTPVQLKAFALAWMEDVWDYCNLSRYYDGVDADKVAFNRAVRQFRLARPWLMENLRADEYMGRRQPADGTAFFYGLRSTVDASEMLLFCANMEGEPVTFIPTALPIPGLPADQWEVALASPGLAVDGADGQLTLEDSEAIVFRRASG